MKKILSNYRYYVLAVVFTVAIIGIFSVPNDEMPTTNWLCAFALSKAIGFAAAYLIARLVKRWEKQGTISELTDIVNNY